jgi:hypothetical protein
VSHSSFDDDAWQQLSKTTVERPPHGVTTRLLFDILAHAEGIATTPWPHHTVIKCPAKARAGFKVETPILRQRFAVDVFTI